MQRRENGRKEQEKTVSGPRTLALIVMMMMMMMTNKTVAAGE